MKKPTSCTPNERVEDWWQTRHSEKIAEKEQLNNKVDLLFLGDSITHAWERVGKTAFKEHFHQYKTLNYGFDGDCTEHLLWRLQNSELEKLRAKYAVLLIGTNNAGHRNDSEQDIADGISAILTSIQQAMPDCQVILCALFPRSRNVKKRLRISIDSSNVLLEQLAKKFDAIWLNINSHLLDKNGILHESVMPDLLHPNAEQYHIWAREIIRTIKI